MNNLGHLMEGKFPKLVLVPYLTPINGDGEKMLRSGIAGMEKIKLYLESNFDMEVEVSWNSIL